MGAIIAALLAAFGPLLAELLKKWLDSLFNKAAKNIDEYATAGELVEEALRLTPRIRVGKRALLWAIREHADDVVDGKKLDAASKKEIKSLAANAV